MRFSLKWMLGAVALVGFGCVALYNANETWATAVLFFTVVVLLVAILGAIYLQPRAFYVGMCIFGWGYLLLTDGPPIGEAVKPLAATDALLDVIYKTMQHGIVVDPSGIVILDSDGARMINNRGPTRFASLMPIRKHFQAVGHSLFALLFGIIGGAVGEWFSRKNRD